MKQRITRLISLILTVAMVLAMLPVTAGAATGSGTCGANLRWTLDDSGTLTISGTGAMTDYDNNNSRVPWDSNKTSITSVVIEDGVTSIGGCAFASCSDLTSVMIPEGVTSIGGSAFYGCMRLRSVAIPEEVTSIGDWAFRDCSGLTKMTIPSGVISIGNEAFGNCSKLTEIIVDERNEKFCAIQGVLYDKNKTKVICYPTGLSGEYVIPSTVTSIGSYAFGSCTGLTSVAIPEGVTSIGEGAFEYCSGLTSVTIPEGVTSIGASAFDVCYKLTNVTIPKGVTSIEGYTFHNCIGLTSVTIPEGVTSIGYYAFSGCSGLTSVTIPEGVHDIEDGAFSDCSGLTSVTIPEGVHDIEDGVFSGCSGLTSVTIPKEVFSIGGSAFYDCSGLTSVTITDSVRFIGDEAFGNCQNLNLTFDGNAPAFANEDVFSGATNITVRYPYGDGTWTADVMDSVSNCTFRAYGQTEFTVSPTALDYNTTDAVITVTSSSIPFDEAQADLVTVDSTDTTDLTVTNAEVVDGALKLTVHSNSGVQTGTISVNIPAAALVADPSDANNETIGESVVTLDVPNPGEVIPQLTPSPTSVPNGSTAPAVTITSSVPFSTGFDITNTSYCTANFGDTELTINSFNRDGTNEITVFFQSAGGDGAQAGNIQLTFLPAAFDPAPGYLVQRNVVYTVSVPLAEYTVSFDGNGGTGDMPSLTVKEDAAFRLPACRFTAPSGQFFAGWCIDRDPTVLAAGAPCSLTRDILLTAQWKALPNVTAGTPENKDDGSVEVVITTDTPVDPDSVGTTIPLEDGGTATITEVSPDGTEITVTITDVNPGDEIEITLPGSIFPSGDGIPYPDITVPAITIPTPYTDRDGDGYDDITGECLHVKFPSMYRAARAGYCAVESCTHPASCACGGPAAAAEPSFTPHSRPKKDTDKVKEEEPAVIEVDDTVETHDPEEIVISGSGEPVLEGINKPGEYVNWIDRVSLPEYALTLYKVLEIGGDNDTLYDLLIKDEYNTLSGGADTEKSNVTVESVVTLVSEMDKPYADGSGIFQSGNFLGGFDTIDTTAGDRAVDYPSLKEGDVVRTSTFNGIYVTKVKKDGNNNYDNEIKEACAYASTSFQAFDRDHPEIFWLSGKSKLRMITAKAGGVKETYVFFVLADHENFTMRDPRYPNQSAIETEITRMETAVGTILQTVTGTTVSEQVRQLNRWLTEHNEYNTSADLQHLPNWPHECMSALVGSVGTDGPVCDGYSRAFKVLCGRLNIPCVLVDGYARTSAQSQGQFHMWNSVQLPDGKWYGVDVTWNDPTVKGVSGAKSGHENENFLLTGGDTVVLGLKFSESHPPVNRAANGGVSFINGPTLSAAAYDPHSPVAGLPFGDVVSGDWFAGEVRSVYEKGIMTGVSANRFAPDAAVSRAMVVSVLYRLEGAPSAEPAGFDDVKAGEWYTAAIDWAAGTGIAEAVEGNRFAPDAVTSREGLALMLWRCAGSPEAAGALDEFSDRASVSAGAEQALRWTVSEGIIVGSSGQLNPKGSVTRAQAAAMLVRYLNSTGKNVA